ncbi:MAG: metal ABC transporter substrate-binding protein [Candidatus Uhrbacteria bacterium]
MNKHLRSLLLFLLIIVLSGTLLAAFKFLAQNSPAKNSESIVAATIFPIYDIAKNIAGSEIKTVLILPPGADAHSFEPSPSLLKELNGAKVVYTIGGNLDNWASVLAQNVGAEIVMVNSGIKLRAANDEEDGPFDPHYWLSVPNAKIIASNIANDLIVRFPASQESITANLNIYLSQLDNLDLETRTALQNLPQKNLVTFHDAWYYFAEEYGLTVAGTFEPTAGREPTPQYLADLVTKLQAAKVKTVYYEPQMSIAGLETFIKDYNVNLAVLDDIGGTAPYDSYLNLIKTNVSTLQKNQ